MKIIFSILVSVFVLINIPNDFPIIVGELAPNSGIPNSRPLYIGVIKDKIKIDESLQQDFEWNGRNYYEKGESYFKYIDSTKVEIFVNTKVDLTKKGLESENEILPVLIKNLENDTIVVGSTHHIPIRLEAKNENGEWQDITKLFGGNICGTGIYPILLYPNHVALTCFELPKQGDYYAALRVRLGGNYSKEFGGIIQKSWFEETRIGW